MSDRIPVNGFLADFTNLRLNLPGASRMKLEMRNVTFGDAITRAAIMGVGQVPIAMAKGQYAAQPLVITTTLESKMELWDSIQDQGKGKGNVPMQISLVVQFDGQPEVEFKFVNATLTKPGHTYAQADASLGVTIEFTCQYMLVNDVCLGDLN